MHASDIGWVFISLVAPGFKVGDLCRAATSGGGDEYEDCIVLSRDADEQGDEYYTVEFVRSKNRGSVWLADLMPSVMGAEGAAKAMAKEDGMVTGKT